MSIVGDHLRDDCMRGMNDIAFDAEMEGCVHEELVRLRAEVATAKRDALEAKQDVRDLLGLKDDNKRLRAEVADLRREASGQAQCCVSNELEVQRLRAEVAELARDEVQSIERLAAVTAERDRLLELLRDALHYVLKGNAIFLADRIDAALQKKEGS